MNRILDSYSDNNAGRPCVSLKIIFSLIVALVTMHLRNLGIKWPNAVHLGTEMDIGELPTIVQVLVIFGRMFQDQLLDSN